MAADFSGHEVCFLRLAESLEINARKSKKSSLLRAMPVRLIRAVHRTLNPPPPLLLLPPSTKIRVYAEGDPRPGVDSGPRAHQWVRQDAAWLPGRAARVSVSAELL